MPNTGHQKKIENKLLKELHFDPQNPRFSRYFGSTVQPEVDIIERMVKNENVQELMGSIGEQGYFVGEPLLVAKDGKNRYIVVEGNRRLAALKLLIGELVDKELPSITRLRETSKIPPAQDVPCIVFKERSEILRYLGYRHITGAKRWDSLSKARYLEELRRTLFANLTMEEQLQRIAQEIGSKPHYVALMLTGLTVFENARQNKFYDLQRVDDEDIDFSVLTTALSRPAIAEYIGLESPRDIGAANLNKERAKELFSWAFAEDEQGNTILGEIRNLGKLAAVVANPFAVATLKETRNLETAYLFSDGQIAAFTKVLNIADKKLREVFKLTSDISDFTDDHLKQIESIADLAEDIQSRIRRAMRRRKDTLND
jgi:thermostable 8-oxoguanine DNA glycosylase